MHEDIPHAVGVPVYQVGGIGLKSDVAAIGSDRGVQALTRRFMVYLRNGTYSAVHHHG